MRKLLIAMALLVGGMTAGAQTTTEDLDAKYGTELLKPGTPAPDFTLRSFLENDTAVFNFKRYNEDAYVVLDFWASWCGDCRRDMPAVAAMSQKYFRSEEHTSELQSRQYLVCRLLLEKKK